MNTETARKMLDACRAKAGEIGKAVSVAIVDAGGNMIVFERVNDARPFTAFVAECKASSSAATGMPSANLAGMAERLPQLAATISGRLNGRFIALQGAVPLVKDGAVVGAIGVSGATSEEDEQIANAGAALL
jgi:uncharacterized protein GlcG (DUF336 family)